MIDKEDRFIIDSDTIKKLLEDDKHTIPIVSIDNTIIEQEIIFETHQEDKERNHKSQFLKKLREHISTKIEILKTLENEDLNFHPVTEELCRICSNAIYDLYSELILIEDIKLEFPMILPEEDGAIGIQIKKMNEYDIVIIFYENNSDVVISADYYTDQDFEVETNLITAINMLILWIKGNLK